MPSNHGVTSSEEGKCQSNGSCVPLLISTPHLTSTSQVLSDSDVYKDDKIARHLKVRPSESCPISDTAISFGGKSRSPSPASMFIPIGHISLDAGGADAYKIASFYVSMALQGHGIGRAAMDLVKAMAVEEPFCAKTLFLCTACNEYYKVHPVFSAHWDIIKRAIGIERIPHYSHRSLCCAPLPPHCNKLTRSMKKRRKSDGKPLGRNLLL